MLVSPAPDFYVKAFAVFIKFARIERCMQESRGRVGINGLLSAFHSMEGFLFI